MEEKKAAEDFRRRQHAGTHAVRATALEKPSTIPPTQIQQQGLQMPPPVYQPPPPDSTRIILHFDADCFYAQCEELRDPSLREHPLGVTQKFLIVTCNYIARARGVTKLMSIKEAMQRCPDLVLVNGEDLTPYRYASKSMISVLKRYGTVQKLGLDEIFVDVTAAVETRLLQSGCGDNNAIEFAGHVHIPGKLQQDNKYRPMDLRAATKLTLTATLLPIDSGNNAAKLETVTNATGIEYPYTSTPWWPRVAIGSILAREARHAVKIEAGLRTSAGISCNKLLSKLSSGLHKPDDQTLLLPCYAAEFVEPLPVRALPGVGLKLEAELIALGVDTVGALRNISQKQLLTKFGDRVGQFLSSARWGKDDSEVTEQGPPKSITVEDSFRGCRGYPAAKQVLQVLSPDLIARLQEEEQENARRPTKLILKWRLKGQGWNRTSASCAFPVAALTQSEELQKVAGQLLAANVKEPFDLTLISIGGTGFADASGSGGPGGRNNERSIADILLGGSGGGVQQTGKQEQPVQIHADALRSSSPSSPSATAGLSLKRRRDYGTGADQVPLSKHAERMLRQGGGGGGGGGISYDDGLDDDDMDLWDDLAGLNDSARSKQHQRAGNRDGNCRAAINASAATLYRNAISADHDCSACRVNPPLDRRVIIHCDIDSFYCSVERLDDPSLRNIPLVVEQFNSGGFVAVSYEARAAGIRCGDGAGAAGRAVISHLAAMKARSVEECKLACPGLVVRGMRPQRYRELGRAVHEMLKSVVGPMVQVEKASCDDFYLDITSLCSSDVYLDTLKDQVGPRVPSSSSCIRQSPPDELQFIYEDREEGSKDEENADKADYNAISYKRLSVWSNISSDLQRGIWIAHSVCQFLSQKLGLTASCAVSRSKLISRLASPVNKPNGLTLVPSEAAAVKFIGAIPINRIPSMQGKFGAEVQETLQVQLVKDLVRFEKKDLEARFGPSRGKFLSDLPAAIDDTPVAECGPPKSITSERSFPPMKNQESVLGILKLLVEQLLLRGAEDFAEHSRLPLKLGIGFRLGYNTNLVSRSGSVPLSLLNWLRSSVDAASFCDGAADAVEVATSAVMVLLRGAANGRWDITRAAVVLHYVDTRNGNSRPEQNGPTIGELFKAAPPMAQGKMNEVVEEIKKKEELRNRAGPSKVEKKKDAASASIAGTTSTYRNAEALALQAMFSGSELKPSLSRSKISNGEDNNLDKASLKLALKLQREEAGAMAASNIFQPSNKKTKKKKGPLDNFLSSKLK
ncbi:hypothetical protein Ndes2526B_g09198 [Nannochloris sp. 'desiccata']